MLLDLVDSYLTLKVSGVELVKIVDDMVGDDVIAGYASEVQEAVYRFQDELSCYVRDDYTRLEAPGIYFRDKELRVRARSFRSELLLIRD